METFVDRLEFFILRKQPNLTNRSLEIYQNIKQLNLLSSTFKYGLLEKLHKQLDMVLEKDLNVKNNELEVLLWFIYREYPYLREGQFQDIASQHTLRLFEMH